MNLRVVRPKAPKKFSLKERDVEIVKMFSNGHTAKTISEIGGISSRTVEAVVSVLMKEYKCDSITHLVARFLRRGLIK